MLDKARCQARGALVYCASSVPLPRSSRRRRESRQAASRQLPSRDSARLVTGRRSSSVVTQPARRSKQRTLPSTLAATISALRRKLY